MCASVPHRLCAAVNAGRRSRDEPKGLRTQIETRELHGGEYGNPSMRTPVGVLLSTCKNGQRGQAFGSCFSRGTTR
jgi:hypothetical protein